MAYKDKDKQREANRERQRRYKARSKALAKGVTSEGVTKGVTVTGEEVVVTLSNAKSVTVTNAKPSVEIMQGMTVMDERSMVGIDTKPKRGKDIKLIEIKPYQMTVVERLFYRPASKLGRGETNFVSLPGRACYGVV